MSQTANYNWNKPTVGGSDGAWGQTLNDTVDAIDAQMKTTSDVATSALPKAGGTMTGQVNVKTATLARVDKGSVSGATPLDLSAGNYFTLTPTGPTTLSFTNVPTGAFTTAVILKITNGGANITWPAGTKWPGGTSPTLTASGIDIVVMMTDDDGTTWRAMVAGYDIR